MLNLKILTLGILLRLILMISSCHLDLFANYYPPHFFVYQHKINQFFITTGASFWPIVYIHGLWLFFIRGFINKGTDLWPQNWFRYYETNNAQVWQQFAGYPDISLTLFLLKLPYFVLEIMMIIFIIKMFPDGAKKSAVFNFLLFNPISLFLIYVFGADDIIPVFFVVVSLFLIKNKRTYLSILSLGVSVSLKPYSFFLFPLFMALMDKKWRERIKLALFGLSPLIILSVIAWIKGKLGTLIKLAVNMPHTDYILSSGFSSYHHERIYFFIFGYCLIIAYIVKASLKNDLFYGLNKYSLALTLFFCSFCFLHPQYFLLLVPLTALQAAEDKKILILFYILTVCFFVYTFQWGRDLSWRLFMPLNPQLFVKLKSPAEFINGFYPVDKFIGIFKTLFAAVSFWMIYLLLKPAQNQNKQVLT